MLSKRVLDERKREWKELIDKWEANALQLENNSDPDLEYLLSENLEGEARQLRKNIRIIVFKRNESRLLQDGNIKVWNEKLLETSFKLLDHIPHDDLKRQNRKILKRNLPKIKKSILKYKSNLGEKLILRTKSQNCDPSLNLEIRKEWTRLLEVMPLEDLVVYSLDVLKTNKLTHM